MGLLNIFDCIHQHTGMSRPEYQILPWGNPQLPASFKLKIEFFHIAYRSAMKVQKCKKKHRIPLVVLPALVLSLVFEEEPCVYQLEHLLSGVDSSSYFLLWALIKTTLQEKSITCMKSGILCQTFAHLDLHQQIYNVPAISLKVQVGRKVEGESIGVVSIIGCQRRLVSSFKVYKFAFWTWEWRLNWG